MDNLRQMYKMQEGQEILKNDEITRSPFVNELIKTVKGLKSGTKRSEDLTANLESLKDTIESLAVTTDILKDTQPASENFEARFARMQELFELVIAEADTMALYVEEEDEKYLDEPLENIKTYIDEILTISDEFKSVEDKQTVYSYSPEINDLIRVGHGYIQGEFKLEPFKIRYDISRQTLEETYEQMKAMETMPHDTQALQEEYPNIIALIESMKEQFDMIQGYLEAPSEDREFLKAPLDKIQENSLEIFKIQLKITEEIERIAEEKKWRVCPRCTEKTPVAEKYCQSCKTLLPPPPEGYVTPMSDLNFVAGESGIHTGEGTPQETSSDKKLVSPHILKIYETAYKVGRKEIPNEEFEGVINWYEDIVNKTKQDLDTLLNSNGLDDEETHIYNETRNLFEEAIDESLAALKELRKYLDDESTDHLVTGVNALLDAGEKLHGVQIAGEIAQQQQAQQNTENTVPTDSANIG